MNYLIDSDWLFDAFEDRGAARDVLEALSDRGLAISILTLGEVYVGIVGSESEQAELRSAARFLRNFEVIGLSASIMLLYARTRRELERRGERLDDFDLLIASTAMDLNLTLITRNRRHFDRIPGLGIH